MRQERNHRESRYNSVVRKWHDLFIKKGIYEGNVDFEKDKFFVNFPYPYINGYLHLGHAYTSMKADFISRLKRKLGFNVLYPQGFHATGQPIIAAADRVREGEEKQIEILKKMGIENVEEFKDPLKWIEFFSEKAYEHLNLLGYGIDWRRKFITTYLNPAYDKFIRWQYKKLYDKGLVYKGSHPVVYCPKDKHAIGDHDRAEGEGVVPEKVVMIKFKHRKGSLVIMTYRPETLWGVTNIWINPSAVYVVYDVGDEKLIISRDVVENFKFQEIEGRVLEEIKGEELILDEVENPITGDKVPILPAKFVDSTVGSGIVMSVPSHAPYDYVALRDLEKDERYREVVERLKMISLIEVRGYGEFPAKEIVERMEIKSQDEKEKLDKATKEIYKVEFHQGVLKDLFGIFAGLYVKDAKDKIIRFIKEKGVGFEFYILPEVVICRCLSKGVVKILHDQWFIKYSDKNWKDKVHEHIDKMEFYPESIKKVFHDTVDWLEDWVFTRERGLGTRFPYDESKIIESLSDSTIYMAYYTIAKYLENPKKYGIDISKIKDSFFDYVFLGLGNLREVAKENGLDERVLERIREEFLYWYKGGFDLRISGKDLIKNHLTMMLFHHVAIFPEGFLPKSIGVNGFVMVDGEKMSKSKGNFYTLKDAYEIFGAEETRFALLYAGNIGIDDPNFETKIIKDIREKLVWFENYVKKYYGKGREDVKEIDLWLMVKIKHLTDLFIENGENLMTRDAVKYGFFEMQNALKWYLRRTGNNIHEETFKVFVEQQLHILSCIIPHYAQELWNIIGNETLLPIERFIEIQEISDSHEILEFEEYLQNLLDDAKELLMLMERKGNKVNKIYMVVGDEWKYLVYDLVKGAKNMKEVMEKAKEEGFYGIDPKTFSDFVNKSFGKIKKSPFEYLERDKEIEWLFESKEFLERELNIKVEIKEEKNVKDAKSSRSLPYKPAFVVVD